MDAKKFVEKQIAEIKRVVGNDTAVSALSGGVDSSVTTVLAHRALGKKLKVIRLEAVRAGFKQCWQNRDYRTIIAVAQRIPENVLQEDPKLLMWYDQALTRLGEE